MTRSTRVAIGDFLAARGLGLASTLALAAAAGFDSAPAHAGGASVYEMGTIDLGTATAGRAALAWDASTAFVNPAGMNRLEDNEAVFGLEGLVIQMKFDPAPETSVAGSPTGSPGGFMPSGSLHAVFETAPGQRFGLSLASTAGLALDYDDDWVGRYYVDESALLTLTLNPSYSVRVNDRIALGGGLDVMVGSLIASVPINNVLDGIEDGRLEVDTGATGFGWNAGVLIEPDPDTRFGFAYRSGVDLDFDDVGAVSGLGPGLEGLLQGAGLLGDELDVGMTIPQELMLSAYQALNEDWALMGNFGWQNWEEFGRVEVSVADSTTVTTPSSYDDTWHVAFGVHYRVKADWLGMAGFAFDSSACEDETRTISMPFDTARRYAIGVLHDQSERLDWGFAYEFIRGGDAPVDQSRPLAGDLVGDFDTNLIHVVAFHTRWRW
jgi:long-chain fatty acid transport protein